MKLVKKSLLADGSGFFKLVPEDSEDMWHAYNLITKGDRLEAKTMRRITRETATGSTSTERIQLRLNIVVSQVDFDPSVGELRVSGQNVTENKFVKMGQFHALKLELFRGFVLFKHQWDTVDCDRITEACDPGKRADLAAIVVGEGLANVCLVTGNMTIVKARIETSIPRKRKGSASEHDKALARFFETILQAILQHVDFSVVKALVMASPGFTKDDLHKYVMEEAQKRDLKQLLSNKDKFLLVHSNSSGKRALTEVLADPAVSSRISDTKAASEVSVLNEFMTTLNDDPDRALYAYSHVSVAAERGAVDRILITDSLFRSNDLETRKKYIALVDLVKEGGGKVSVFSSMHTTGEQLASLSGVACLCRFPVPDIAEMDFSDDGSGSDSDDD